MFVIEHIPDSLTIPKTWFRFVSKSHLIGLGETPPYYPGTHHSFPSDLMSAPYTVILTSVQTMLASYQKPETTPKREGESYVLLILTDER